MLRDALPYYSCLPDAKREELEDHVKVFIDEKHFEGAGGVEVTEEMKVVIAAQACVLLLGRVTDYYHSLKSIIIYPRTFSTNYASPLAGGLDKAGPDRTLGEWSPTGAMALSWDSVVRGARDPCDGNNVVFHEFAHQLDAEDGSMNGAPDLETRPRYTAWASVLSEEYLRLKRELSFNIPTVIDGYGATNAREFFAVVTEAFFERPGDLRRMHPELYARFRDFYKQDPAEWTCRETPDQVA